MATDFTGVEDLPATRSETSITTSTITATDLIGRIHVRCTQSFEWSTSTGGADVPADADVWTQVWERAGNRDLRNYEISITLSASGDMFVKAEGLR